MKKQLCACRFSIFNYIGTVGGGVRLLSAARLFELMSLTHTHTPTCMIVHMGVSVAEQMDQ